MAGHDNSQVHDLDLICGSAENAARALKRIAADIAYHDGLPESTALKLAVAGAADGDPRILAAPGQIWSVRPGADPHGEAPARRLAISARLTDPPRILAWEVDGHLGSDEPAIEMPPPPADDDRANDAYFNNLIADEDGAVPLDILSAFYQLDTWTVLP